VYYGDDDGKTQGKVRLEICILHPDELDRPVDAAEIRALREVEGRLEDLGVTRR